MAAGVPGATFAYLAALGGVFVGGFYSFRLVFFAFHGKERFDTHGHGHDAHGHDDHGHGGVPHESPLVVTIPLILLAIPSMGRAHAVRAHRKRDRPRPPVHPDQRHADRRARRRGDP